MSRKTMRIPFTKMQADGNSFAILELKDIGEKKDPKSFVADLCSASLGLGVDGLVVLHESPDDCDFFMVMYNKDGSRASMCGNVLRCLAKYVFDKKKITKKELRFKTASGERRTRLLSNNAQRAMVEVDMGIMSYESKNDYIKQKDFSSKILGRDYFFVNMGNPHAVCFVDDFDFDYHSEASNVQKQKQVFPNGVNVEYANFSERDGHLEVRVLERGVGETFSCGTGACAVVASLISNKKLVKNKDIKVDLLGGSVEILIREDNSVLMRGEAKEICEGTFAL